MPSVTDGSPGCKPVTNEGFLRAIFGARNWQRAHVCAVPGDPNDPASRAAWAGGPPPALRELEDGSLNQYWTVSLFHHEAGTGRFVRRIANFAGYYAVIFDDVGPKVDGRDVLARIGAPSWRLETSPGNEQWGYILDTPERDLGRANGLTSALVAAGVSSTGRDPGMVGVTRYARMPVGTNGKASAGRWRCAMRAWSPTRTFTMEEIAAGWDVVLPAPGTVTVHASPVLTAGATDAWLDAMAGLGRVQGPAGSGWGYLVTCPYVEEHTARADTGTAYRPGVRRGEPGSWKCNHGHCENRPQNEFFARLECDLPEPMRVLEFTDVSGEPGALLPPASALSPTAGTPEGDFLSEFVFMREDDAFLSLRSLGLQSRKVVNSAWAERLRGACTYTHTRTLGQGTKQEREVEEEKVLPVDRWFFDQRGHREADRQTYWPGADLMFTDMGVDLVNRYREVARTPGLARVENGPVREWLNLVWHVVGGEGPRNFVRLLDWMAAVAGSPGFKPAWFVVVVGAQGIGKDMMMRPMAVAVGRDNIAQIGGAELGGGFTSYAEKRLVLVAELKQTTRGSTSGHDQYNRLKALVDNTQPFIPINPKYAKPYSAKNTCAVFASSNERNAVAVDEDDRRAFVVVSDAAKWGAVRYATLDWWMKELGGLELVAEWLRQRWDRMPAARRDALSRPAPATRGKRRMMAAGAGALGEWVAQQIEDAGPSWPTIMSAEEVQAAVQAAVDGGRAGLARGTHVPAVDALGRVLAGLGAVRLAGGQPVRVAGVRRRLWAVRNGAALINLGGAAIVRLKNNQASDAAGDFTGSEVVDLSSPSVTKDK